MIFNFKSFYFFFFLFEFHFVLFACMRWGSLDFNFWFHVIATKWWKAFSGDTHLHGIKITIDFWFDGRFCEWRKPCQRESSEYCLNTFPTGFFRPTGFLFFQLLDALWNTSNVRYIAGHSNRIHRAFNVGRSSGHLDGRWEHSAPFKMVKRIFSEQYQALRARYWPTLNVQSFTYRFIVPNGTHLWAKHYKCEYGKQQCLKCQK